jgi:hypothetical protein
MPSPDHGAARDRTVLARQRAAFSYGGLAALFLTVAAHRELRWPVLVSVALLALAAAVWVGLHRPAALATATAAAAACALATVLS